MSDIGSVGQADPTTVSTPTTGTSMPSNWVQGLMQLNPTTAALSNLLPGSSGGASTLANYALVAVGAILALGALLISSKQTVIQVATHAGGV